MKGGINGHLHVMYLFVMLIFEMLTVHIFTNMYTQLLIEDLYFVIADKAYDNSDT